MLSILDIVQTRESPDLLLVDQSANSLRAKMLILIDICTTLHKSVVSTDVPLDGDDDDDTITLNIETSCDGVKVESINFSSRPNWHLYESTLTGEKMVKFEVIQQQVARYIHKTICELDWTDHFSEVR